jgi:catechol 2,3-dioxygenase
LPAPDYGIAPPEYRLPDSTRLGAVGLQVRDLARSIEYYERVIGLRRMPAPDGEAALGPEGDDRPLVRLKQRDEARPVPPGGRLGLYHFAILVPDRASLGRFVRHLGELGEYAGSADHAVSEALYLNDPDGLGIEVYADRPRSTWAYEARQLYMTTERLDIRSLLAAGGDRVWTGMPSRTVMGHVHLHVGDLDRAAAFYHQGLGLDKTVWSYPGALFLSAGGYHHHLGTNTWSSGPPAGDQDARLLSWTMVLPAAASVAAAAESLESAGYAVQREGERALAADPWGTTIRMTSEKAPDPTTMSL